MKIRTARLEIRPATLEDLDDWCSLEQVPSVQRCLPTTVTRQMVAEELSRQLALGRLHQGYGWFSLRHEGWFIGRCALRPGSNGDIFNPHIAYHVRADMRGQGLAREAATALVDAAFEELSITTVNAITAPENLPSARVLQSVGFSRTSSPLADLVRHRITLEDWLDQRDDVRRQLHDRQAAALRKRDKESLEALRQVGMALAVVEADGSRASACLVRQLAEEGGIVLEDPASHAHLRDR